MKRIVTFAMMIVLVSSLFASSMISQPAATVYLIRNKAITIDELNAEVESYRAIGATDISAMDVLQTMINDEVFLQGAERDGISISNRQLDQIINTVYQNAVQQATAVGQIITREDFDAEIIRQFGSIDAYREMMRNQSIVQQYLMQERGDVIMDVPTPSESAISSFYRQNQQSFFQPECVKLAHIYIPKTGVESEDSASLARMEEASRRIKNGEITFESAVPQYSEDTSSNTRGGDIGWLTANNTSARQGWGDDFCDEVLAMGAGDISPVLESYMGYHIVKVTVHYEAKLLSLTDPISPEDTITVHDYIAQAIMSQTQQNLMAQELQSMIADLRNQARINILYRGN